MFLIVDTETNGMPISYHLPSEEVDNWPRIVQLAWMLCGEVGNEIEFRSDIIRPEGWTMDAGAMRVHGITLEHAFEVGIPIEDASSELEQVVSLVRGGLVAHNLNFDRHVIGAELIRLSRPNVIYDLPRFCTMNAGTSLCRIPSHRGFKWPKLRELHQHLFNEEPSDQHDAGGDVRACKRCFFEMRKRGVFNTSAVVA